MKWLRRKILCGVRWPWTSKEGKSGSAEFERYVYNIVLKCLQDNAQRSVEKGAEDAVEYVLSEKFLDHLVDRLNKKQIYRQVVPSNPKPVPPPALSPPKE
jgi:hypothetical protein